jgi:hypothetical protein
MRTTLAKLFFALGLAVYAGWAGATYVFTKVDVPGSTYTTLWGINNNGQAAADAIVGGKYSAYVYVSGQWIPLPAPPAGLSVAGVGINDSLVVVGGAFPADVSFEQGFILDLLTATYVQFFSHPGSSYTEARAIGNSGLVTGYSSYSCSSGIGWIYDPGTNTFSDIDAGGIATLAQGMNAAGQVVGNYFTGYDPSSCSWFGGQSFLREPDGSITLFDINGWRTRARGINDNGLIAGFVVTPSGNQAFVGNSSGFQLLSVPGSIQTIGEGLNNAGQVTGGYTDADGSGHGFIATPATLPTGTTATGAYTFNVDVVPDVEIFIDPSVALGYDYAIGPGNPMFASVQLPIGIGNSLYTLITHGRSFGLAGGDVFDFRTHGFPNGVAQFRVADIEASAALDPADPTAFVTGLSFVAAGSFTGTMTPLCQGHSLPVQAKVPPGRALSPCGE